MDTLAHGIWATLIGRAGHLKTRWWVLALMSAGPDLVWLPFTAWHWLQAREVVFFDLPYQVSHSLIIWMVLTLLASIRWRWAIAVTWPWALHILIDIPGHQNTLTPFLWPLSSYTFYGGWEWLELRWMMVNYLMIMLVSLGLWVRRI